MTASPLIAEYDVPVMALGGFSGRDQAIDVTQFADLVEAGKVRYVLVSNGGPGSGIGGSGAPGAGAVGGPGGSGTGTNGGASIMNAIRSTGRVVTDPGLPSQYQGQIYDVSGTAAGLRALVQ
jgi:4-amino-4-deoxy-L-arabinose transferase-like glycosyltransferase